jgi:hypothetical protein
VVDPGSWDFIGDIPENAGLAVGSDVAADVGLSTPHILPQTIYKWSWLRPDPEPPAEKPDRSAYLKCWLGGSLLETGRARSGGERGQVGGGPRGSITRFSFASRRRLLRRLAQTRRGVIPLFVTLTYPDHFPADPVVWKNDLKKFWQRLARKFPKSCFVWRLHTLERKSGDNAGEIAPHFHLLVWGVGLGDLRGFVSQAWFETVASGDGRHLRAGTRVEMPRSFKGVMRYCGNELGKVEQATPVDTVGRWWGFYGRKLVPWVEAFLLPVADQDAVKVMRWFRRFAGLKARSYKTLAVFADPDFWLRKIRAGPDPPMSYGTWVDNLAGS